jgi:hypothetical protein
VENGNCFVDFGESAFETLDRLRSQRNFRDENDRVPAAVESGANRLQINFGFPAPSHAVQQNRFCRLRRRPRLGNFLERRSLFRIQLEVRTGDECCRVRSRADRLSRDRSSRQLGAQRLIIE